MQFIPAAAYQYLHMMSGMGIPLPSGTLDMEEYREWMHTQREYATRTGASGLVSTNFYLVLSFPQEDFADKIEMHPDLPMMVPASGTAPPILGIFSDDATASKAMSKDTDHVHLMYKLRLRGHVGVSDFLEFMATHDMMENMSP